MPSCTLRVTSQEINPGKYCFKTTPITDTPCSYSYQGNDYQVFLGLEATAQNLLTYDKGIDPNTGKGIWGALLDAYRFTKIQDFSDEIANG